MTSSPDCRCSSPNCRCSIHSGCICIKGRWTYLHISITRLLSGLAIHAGPPCVGLPANYSSVHGGGGGKVRRAAGFLEKVLTSKFLDLLKARGSQCWARTVNQRHEKNVMFNDSGHDKKAMFVSSFHRVPNYNSHPFGCVFFESTPVSRDSKRQTTVVFFGGVPLNKDRPI